MYVDVYFLVGYWLLMVWAMTVTTLCVVWYLDSSNSVYTAKYLTVVLLLVIILILIGDLL